MKTSTPRKHTGKTSKFFTSPAPAKSPRIVGAPVVPPAATTDRYYGLIQEKLAHQPFWLFVAVILLQRTPGARAVPVLWRIIDNWPTPEDLVHASLIAFEDLVELIEPLGFVNRAERIMQLARRWVTDPPTKGKRFRTSDYPHKGAHKGIDKDEVLADDDERPGAFELGGFPGAGAYAMDSWRIFCRDECRGLATDWNGAGNTDPTFQPEWMRVIPNDKELIPYLQWMWLKEGFVWDPTTGERTPAEPEVLKEALERRREVIGETRWLLEDLEAEEFVDQREKSVENLLTGQAQADVSTIRRRGGRQAIAQDTDNEDNALDGQNGEGEPDAPKKRMLSAVKAVNVHLNPNTVTEKTVEGRIEQSSDEYAGEPMKKTNGTTKKARRSVSKATAKAPAQPGIMLAEDRLNGHENRRPKRDRKVSREGHAMAQAKASFDALE